MSGVRSEYNILLVLNSYFVRGERDGGDGYHGQGESAGGPRHAGHHLQLPGPSVCEDRQTCINVSKKI